MNLDSIIMGGILLAVFIVPLVLMVNAKRAEGKRMLKPILEMANKDAVTIAQYDHCGNFVIAIDSSNSFVFFLREVKGVEEIQRISLKDFKSCKIQTTHRRVEGEVGSNSIIERLSLIFSPKSGDHDIKLEFYNIDVNAELYGELQMIDKWYKLIDQNISHA